MTKEEEKKKDKEDLIKDMCKMISSQIMHMKTKDWVGLRPTENKHIPKHSFIWLDKNVDVAYFLRNNHNKKSTIDDLYALEIVTVWKGHTHEFSYKLSDLIPKKKVKKDKKKELIKEICRSISSKISHMRTKDWVGLKPIEQKHFPKHAFIWLDKNVDIAYFLRDASYPKSNIDDLHSLEIIAVWKGHAHEFSYKLSDVMGEDLEKLKDK